MRIGLLVLAGVLLPPVQALAQKVTIGTAAQYEVGDFTVAPAVMQGFERALSEALCQRGNLSCEWEPMAQDGLLPALKAKEVDVVMAAIPITAQLGDGLETTAAYLYPDPFDFVGPPGFDPFGNVKTAATISDPAIDAWHTTTPYNVMRFDTLEEALEAVERGDAEIAVGERIELAPLVDATEGRLAVVAAERRLRPGVTMALHADNFELRFAFEDLIYEMTQDGSLNALTKEWFGKDAVTW
ncbi:MAG: transporter substrate-binding domain-containing protein [Rhodobacter sp.]|nr:transporter substrate-binding domain-containing protein [Rhodobacter sp.]